MKTFISILMLLLFPLSVYSGQIDSPAPSFSLKDAKGKTVTLADYRGKVLLLDFWAPWCGPCKEEMPELEALYGKYGKDGFEIIGISVDTSERSVSSFLQKVPLSFTILLDQSGKVAEAYRFSHLPTGFIVGRDGVIRHIHKGFAKNFVPVYEKEIEDLLKQQ